MVELPSYVRLVVSNVPRGKTTQGVPAETRAPRAADDSLSATSADREVVSLVSAENRRAAQDEPPTLAEAEAALRALQDELPGAGQTVGDIHSRLDRRVILSLLAPLVS